MSYIRIYNDVFEVDTISIQTTIGSHATIYISVDIENRANYLNYFINLFDNKKKFDLVGGSFIGSFIGKGSFIKYIDVVFNKRINLTIRTDILYVKDISERREEIIEEILNNNKNLE